MVSDEGSILPAEAERIPQMDQIRDDLAVAWGLLVVAHF
jgi:hypothetical protein